MDDYPTTAARISNLFSGGYWARRQLHASIKNVPMRSILMELQGWRSKMLDGRLLHNRCTDFDSLSRWLLGSTLATCRYKVRVGRIKTHEIAVFCGGGVNVNYGGILLDSRFLHNHCTDCNSDSGRLLGLISASQRYKVRPNRRKAPEVTVFCEWSLTYYPGGILLDGRFLHNRGTDSNSDCGRLLGLISVSQRYKVRLCRMKTQEVAVQSRGSTQAEFYLMADSSTTTRRIPILLPGGCWAQR